MTESELQTLNVYESELGAHLTENLLGNESFIGRLVGKETKLAEKVLNKIADLKKMFERIGNAEARAEYQQIKKAEKLYLGAVEKAGYAYVGRKIVASRREEIDADEEIRYNGNVKFSKKDEGFRRYYNPKIKDLLSPQEWRRWYENRAEYIRGGRFLKIDNNILIPINGTKVVIADIRFENPYAKDVLVLTDNFDGDAKSLISYIEKEVIRYGYSIQEIWRLAKNVYGEKIFDIHHGAVGIDSESKQGRESSIGKDNGALQGSKFGARTSTRSAKTDSNTKFSLKESVEKDVLARCGSTYRWAETGYIFKDGTRLDLSGRRDSSLRSE